MEAVAEISPIMDLRLMEFVLKGFLSCWKLRPPIILSYMTKYPHGSVVVEKSLKTIYSVGQKGYNEQRSKHNSNKNQNSRCSLGEFEEASKKGRHRLHYIGSPYDSRENGFAKKLSTQLDMARTESIA